MTNKEDIDGEPCDTRLATLLAIQLVGQVLDEAYVIANAVRESDQPWNCQAMIKNITCATIEIDDEENIYAAYKGDCEDNVSDHENDVTNAVVTSTPQKMTDDIVKVKIDAKIIGQGDGEIDMQDNDLNNSTSTFINHLFDMSDVERIIIHDDNEFMPRNIEPRDFPPLQDITKMMESYVNAALSMAFVTEAQNAEMLVTRESSRRTYSGYSLLSDASAFNPEDLGKDVGFIINDRSAEMIVTNQAVTVEKVIELEEVEDVEEEESEKNYVVEEEIETKDSAIYENAYLTLNRDYEQCSEEEEPVLLDPKGITMQEVELMTANSSDDDSPSDSEQKCNEMAATSAVSAVSRKSLVNRCRSQGARLLACLRGWWRRKTPGKRKEARVSGSIRGICPLSPDARRRAASVLDNRRLGSSSPNHSVVWKFNTVNEALVNSSRWKEYTFDVKADECGEY